MVRTFQYFKDKFITGYKPTQEDYTDLVDTLTNMPLILEQTGGTIWSPDGSSFTIQITNDGIVISNGVNSTNIILDSSGIAIGGGALPVNIIGSNIPLVYKALLSQTGTNAPTIESNGTGANTPLVNTVGFHAIVWSYVSVGTYLGTLAGAFADSSKILLRQPPAQGLITGLQPAYAIKVNDADSIILYTYDILSGPNVVSNDLLLMTSVEIEIYP